MNTNQKEGDATASLSLQFPLSQFRATTEETAGGGRRGASAATPERGGSGPNTPPRQRSGGEKAPDTGIPASHTHTRVLELNSSFGVFKAGRGVP